MTKSKNNYYAYYLSDTKEEGILDNWKECEKKVKGQNARYKGFITKQEATDWLSSNAKLRKYPSKSSIKTEPPEELEDAIYFDSGTGAGKGVEIRITDKNKNSLLLTILPEEILNSKGNYLLGKDVTNNFGELTASLLALQIALKTGQKKVFGDSQLVIKYWSKGVFHKEKLPEQTSELIEKVTTLRKEFEKKGGKLLFISGDYNPADLGYHKTKP